MNTIFIAGGVLGGVVGYLLILRPILQSLPIFAKFFAEEKTFAGKAWAVCGRSASILWSYILALLGGLWSLLDPLAQVLGDPDLKAQILDSLKDHPQIVGNVVLGIAGITLVSRLRSIRKGGK
ncbi:hypothetical protein [Bradyrhizobium sp. Ai1a-2]|uniref:hypothetical protein n=1 Tax=Bradyrhizobium sp. Ai1a-2 TaxID=196490 RepID=UPI00041D2BBA|nr:hypothetical protein [Bradyrhizobium sp. Ai1a-2]